MHCLTLFSLCVALKSTLIASETEDLFSSNPSELGPSYDLFLLTTADPLIML